MSDLIVKVCEIAEINVHPNADRLEIALIGGWPIIVQKDLVKVGDPVVFFPPDSVLTEELADKLGIRQYLVPIKGEKTSYRVRAARLRGVASYGTIDHEVPEGFKVGDDVAEVYGVTKWEPAGNNGLGVDGVKSRRAQDKPRFHRYKDIQNIRHNRGIFKDGEEVVITEKLHGQNLRVGYVKDSYTATPGIVGTIKNIANSIYRYFRPYEFVFMSGSHNRQTQIFNKDGTYTDHAIPLANPDVRAMLEYLGRTGQNVIMFGELIGSGVQDMTYGYGEGERSFRAFDITIDGKYLDADVKDEWFDYYNIPTVPVLYQGPFSWDLIERFTDGPTTLCEPSKAGKFKGREGIVVTALKEPRDYPGRKIFKSVSADYLARKNGTDGH